MPNKPYRQSRHTLTGGSRRVARTVELCDCLDGVDDGVAERVGVAGVACHGHDRVAARIDDDRTHVDLLCTD